MCVLLVRGGESVAVVFLLRRNLSIGPLYCICAVVKNGETQRKRILDVITPDRIVEMCREYALFLVLNGDVHAVEIAERSLEDAVFDGERNAL